MKKITIILFAVLLIVALVACAEDDTTVEDYLVLEARFNAFEDETNIHLDIRTEFNLLAVNGAVLHLSHSIDHVDGEDEFRMVQRVYDGNRALQSELELLVVDGVGYINFDTLAQSFEDELAFDEQDLEMFEELGVSAEDITLDNIFEGNYTHIRISEEELAEILEDENASDRGGLYGAFSEETLNDHLSYSNEVFNITIEGESVARYLDAMLEGASFDELDIILPDLMRLVDIDDDLLYELEDDFGGWLMSADFSDARLVLLRREAEENVYSQQIEIYIPGFVFIDQWATIRVGDAHDHDAPVRYLTQDEFLEQVELWCMDLMLEALAIPLNDDDTETPSTPDGSLLEPYTLVSPSGFEVEVVTIRGADTWSWRPGELLVETDAIMIDYMLDDEYDFSEMIAFITEDLDSMIYEDGENVDVVLPLTMNQDGTAAVVGLASSFEDFMMVVFAIMQDVPDSDYVLLTALMFDGDVTIWTPSDIVATAELGLHFDIDFMAILGALL